MDTFLKIVVESRFVCGIVPDRKEKNYGVIYTLYRS